MAKKSGKGAQRPRLLSLPAEVLQTIVRLAGPPACTTEGCFALDSREHLELRLSCKALRDAVDKELTVACLRVDNSPRPGALLADAGDYIRQYLPRWPSLTGLNLDFALSSPHMDYMLTTAARARPTLRLLHLKIDVEQATLETETSSCLDSLNSLTNLQELLVEGAEVYPGCLNSLTLPSLQKLVLTDAGPGLALEPLPALRTLTIIPDILNRRFLIIPASLPHLHESSALTSLNLRSLQLPALRLPPTLRTLDLFEVAAGEGWDPVSTRLPSLTSVGLDRVRITGAEFLLLNISLTSVQFSKVYGVTNLSALTSLSSLTFLFMHCHVAVPQLPDLGRLHALTYVDIGGFKLVNTLPALDGLPELRYLRVIEMARLSELPDLGSQLSALSCLEVSNCAVLQNMPSLSSAINLKRLMLEGLPLLQPVPQLSTLSSLELLKLSGFKMIEELPTLTSLQCLNVLKVARMDLLENLPDIQHLSSIRRMQVAECPRVDVGGCKFPYAIEHLSLSRLEKLERVPLLGHCHALRELHMTDCHALKSAIIPRLRKLRTLKLAGCTSLQRLALEGKSPYLKYINIAGCPNLPGINLTPQLECDDNYESTYYW